jgi:hypothetical protein
LAGKMVVKFDGKMAEKFCGKKLVSI